MEDIANNFEKAMKKGFLSILILAILEENSTHGYGILKEIEKKTLGIWKTPPSSMYTALKTLEDKELITSKEIEDNGKVKKIYTITTKGEKTFKLMLKKHRRIRNSIHFLFESTLGDDDLLIPKDTDFSNGKNIPKGPPHFPFQFIFNNISEDPPKIQIEFLIKMGEMIKINIETQKDFLKNIEEKISELNKL